MWHPIYFIFVLGFMTCGFLFVFAFKFLSKGWSFKILFKEFNRKMWMTICLGGMFFTLYLAVIFLSVYLVRPSATEILFYMHQHPIEFIYGGLCLFAFLSLSIYLARMFIKYIYLTRGKDS